MESRRGLKKGQYSSPQPVCVRVLLLPVFHTLIAVSTLTREIKRDVYFYTKERISVSFIPSSCYTTRGSR